MKSITAESILEKRCMWKANVLWTDRLVRRNVLITQTYKFYNKAHQEVCSVQQSGRDTLPGRKGADQYYYNQDSQALLIGFQYLAKNISYHYRFIF